MSEGGREGGREPASQPASQSVSQWFNDPPTTTLYGDGTSVSSCIRKTREAGIDLAILLS